ncbi:hypothetical protein [Streptomyces fradiae]|uniref:hypothetical protein n=1 Tax=Streptomyces fradiae TaxID=1906 RepID=UPI002943DD3F|nr:hypothetical protein [Streptomyces fradiae]WOI61530.1 hypothetical protein RYQ63_17390 [Streptomyces fradiae]
MHPQLAPLAAATTQWLLRAYPPENGAVDRALAEAQARQAVAVAAALCYPTDLDAALVALTGGGGADRLDRVTGAEADEAPWRSWVDEVLASWAACLLGEPRLAEAAVAAAAATAGHASTGYRRLLAPGERDLRAAALLRHPDLLAPVADLHRARLLAALALDPEDPAVPV